jgi:hypothetical protein
MRFRRTLALALVSVASCTSASGDVVGGAPRDGYDASFPAALDVPITEPTYLDAPKLSWAGIYRDYFGRRALSSCAGRTSCHADATGLGATGSNFVCADKDSCWDTMRHRIDDDAKVSTVPLIADSDVAAPENAYLFRVVRVITRDGLTHANKQMPKVPSDFYFKADDIDRMQTWIRNGALND